MWQNEPFPMVPPPDADPQWLAWWAEFMTSACVKHSDNVDRILNGQVEFPTPSAPDHTGNLKVSYVQILFNPVSGGAGDTPAIQVRHGYGDGENGNVPRGWFQMANSLGPVGGSGNGRFLDQILSSASAAPLYPPGYASLTTTSATTLTGTGVANLGWIYNGVRVGDEIKCHTTAATGVFGTVVAGSGVINLSAAPAVPLQKGWWVYLGAGNDQGWHLIDEVNSTTQITVIPEYILGVAGAAMTRMSYDQAWRRITAVTDNGVGNPDTLTLEAPGTEVPTGIVADYVIRRPPTENFAWVRFLGGAGGTTETTLAFY